MTVFIQQLTRRVSLDAPTARAVSVAWHSWSAAQPAPSRPGHLIKQGLQAMVAAAAQTRSCVPQWRQRQHGVSRHCTINMSMTAAAHGLLRAWNLNPTVMNCFLRATCMALHQFLEHSGKLGAKLVPWAW